ncbi:MAG: glycine cleavage system aminomethyltransferase GcvT [Breznakibacter sp.]
MKKTVFNEIHRQCGGKMVPFAGFDMPVEFAGITAEHMAVRNSVGVFDVSHMGEIWVKGPQALAFVQKVTSNDAAALTEGKIQYSCFPNGKGGIVDDLLVYHYSENKYLLVVNASNIEKDLTWCVSQNTMGAVIQNASDDISQLAIQGPNAQKVLQRLTSLNLAEIPYYTFKVADFAGVKEVIVSNTGYTGAGGFELYMYNNDAITIYKAIMEAGQPEGIVPVGLGARDTLRLEMGFCLYGNDIDDTTSPIEAGLGWITKFVDHKDFIDKDLLLKQKKEGVARRLRGFEMVDRGIPRHDYEVVDADGNVIGRVTSGTQSPVLQKGIGMAYIDANHAELGREIFIRVRGRDLKAKIVKTPFI